ncbi:hypothetical protein ACGFY6_33350 [Streptomyces sp. NPDC048387]|uniref:hypothetical protein n=1 Tax=Streptomyces sp. NPDC048387 TaxID=3365542 RepID=UPI0037140732
MPHAEAPSASGTSLWRHGDFGRYLTGQAASVIGSRAVMDGHGRPFTPEEENQLTVLSVLDAVSGISYGTAHGDPTSSASTPSHPCRSPISAAGS